MKRTASVLTTTLNAAETLETYLRSIADQTVPPCELIVIDGGSTDGTLEILKKYEGVIQNLRTIHCPGAGLGASRAVGATMAQGDIVIVLDADEVIPPVAIEIFLEGFNDPAVAGVGARLVPLGSGWVIEGTAGARKVKHRLRRVKGEEVLVIPGGCLALRKSALERIGGFPTDDRIADDWNLCLRLRRRGFQLRSIESLEIGHRDPTNFRQLWRRQFQVGRRVLPTTRHHANARILLRTALPILPVLSLPAILVLFGLAPQASVILLAAFLAILGTFLKASGASWRQSLPAIPVLAVDCLAYTAGFVTEAFHPSQKPPHTPTLDEGQGPRGQGRGMIG